MTTGQRITEQREQQGISAAQLAQQAGIARSYLHSIEHDPKARPAAEVLYDIAEVLGVSFEYLLGKRDINGRRLSPDVPAEIASLAESDGLSESDAYILACLSADGKPRSVEDWRFIYQAIGYVCGGG